MALACMASTLNVMSPIRNIGQKGGIDRTVTIACEPHVLDTPCTCSACLSQFQRKRSPSSCNNSADLWGFHLHMMGNTCFGSNMLSFPICWPIITATLDLALHKCLCDRLLRPHLQPLLLQVLHGENHLPPLQAASPSQPQVDSCRFSCHHSAIPRSVWTEDFFATTGTTRTHGFAMSTSRYHLAPYSSKVGNCKTRKCGNENRNRNVTG